MSFLFGVPAQLKALKDNIATMLTRWSQPKADFLDAAMSSRAPASTALSTVQWTNGRAANLDLVPGLGTSLTAVLDSGAIDSVVAASAGSGGLVAGWQTALDSIGGVTTVSTTISASGYTQTLLVNGKGVAEFIAFTVSSYSAGTYGYRITIDGVVVFDVTNFFTAGPNGSGVIVCGALALNGSAAAGLALGSWPFATSLKLEIYSSTAAGSMRTYYKHRRTT